MRGLCIDCGDATTIAKTLTAYELKSTTPATPEQLARVADAKAGKKDGLKGLALAAWIVTGQGSQEQATAARLKREAADAGKRQRPSPGRCSPRRLAASSSGPRRTRRSCSTTSRLRSQRTRTRRTGVEPELSTLRTGAEGDGQLAQAHR